MTELLRVLPMSVQDLVDEWFEYEPLKAAIAAAGVRDIRQGPRSGGTSFVLLHHLVGAPAGSVNARGWWRDGPDAFTVTAEALARKAGVAIRTGAYVTQITVRDDAVTGVVLANGDEINAPVVMSGVEASVAAAGFQGNPVNIVPRSHSVMAQAPPNTTTRATRSSRPKRHASPAAIAG